MKVTVLYNLVQVSVSGQKSDLLVDKDTVITAKSVARALKSAGYEVELFSVDEKSVKKINPQYPTDIFFNNAFGIGSLPNTEVKLAEILEKTGIPTTGATSKNISLTTDKCVTKKILAKHSLPTPGNKSFPLIVKPAREDSSLGITQNSVVQNKRELDALVIELESAYHEPALVEEYIDGRELNVSVIGNGNAATVLPISEIIFGKKFPGKYHIVDFASKWKENTAYYQQSKGTCPAKLDQKTLKLVKRIAKKAFIVTGCTDFARVDMRLDKNGKPWILEVNANPGIGPKDGLVRSAKAAGFSYGGFLQHIISLALARNRALR